MSNSEAVVATSPPNQSAHSSHQSNPTATQSQPAYTNVAGLILEGRAPLEPLVPCSTTVDMESIADEMANTIKRHCVLTDEEVNAVVLWIISSYLINQFRIFPKLTLISPEKRCGKSTTLEVILSLVRDGFMTSNLSPATLYRVTEKYQPTLLIDEADTFIKGGDSDLFGLINSGHNRAGANVMRCTGDEHNVGSFTTWMPMVLASIGKLADTIMDRSVHINIRRMKAGERVQRLPSDIKSANLPIRQKVARWCLDNLSLIDNSLIEPPRIGNDRAVDNWLPLFTVAGLIGTDWQTKCECAYKTLTHVQELDEPTQLLFDIREVFSQSNEPRIASADLLKALLEDTDSFWHESNRGRAITASYMARLLNPYNIKPINMRFGAITKRGYEANQFDDAFERYLPTP